LEIKTHIAEQTRTRFFELKHQVSWWDSQPDGDEQ